MSGRLLAFAPYGRRAGSSRVRVYEWVDHLGLDATILPFVDDTRAGVAQIARRPRAALRRHHDLVSTRVTQDDVVLIHREITPLTDGRAEARLLRSAGHGVVDLDDGLQWDWGQGGIARRARPKSSKTLRMVRAADVVIAGNDLIAEWAAPHARDVVVVPSCVNVQRYRRKSSFTLSQPPRIGWIGSAATERHLASLAGELWAVHRETGARVTVLGDATPKLGTLEAIIDRVGWAEDAAYTLPASWDVGVMPLVDGLLERAKCAYKLLQYGAARLPAVTSRVGVNDELVWPATDGGPGDLVDLLRRDASDREERADHLHARVVASYSYEANAATWARAVSAAGPPSAEDGAHVATVARP